jgi:hypothetical protein
MCPVGDQPPVSNQNFGKADRLLPIPHGVGATVTDISQTNGGFIQTLEPVVQFL